MSAARAAATVEILGQCQINKRAKQLRERVLDSLKDATEVQLIAIDAILNGSPEDSKGPSFPRVVTKLGGPSPRGVPDYVKASCLAVVTGTPRAALNAIRDFRNVVNFFYLWAISVHEDAPMPERCMTHAAFVEWYERTYKECGSKLEGFDLTDDLCQTTEVGEFAIVKSDLDQPYYDAVYHRASDQTAKLSFMNNSVHIPEADLPSTWFIKHNWCVATARLVTATDGSGPLLKTLFPTLQATGDF